MRYEKKEYKRFNLHLLNTKKFKTTVIKVVFTMENKKEEATKKILLTNLITEGTKNFPEEYLVIKETESLYNLKLSLGVRNYGNYSTLNYTMSFLDSVYSEKNIEEKAIGFLNEVIYSPLLENDLFNEEKIENAKKKVIQKINIEKNDHFEEAQITTIELMHPKSKTSILSRGYIEDLEKINNQELVEYYKDITLNKTVDVFICGRINNKNKLTERFKTMFNQKNENQNLKDFSVINEYSKKEKEIIKKSLGAQSELVMGYDIKSLNNYEKFVILPVFNIILGGSATSRIFTQVREEQHLAYMIGSVIAPINNILLIVGQINSKNYQVTKKSILEIVQSLQKDYPTKEELTIAIKNFKTSLKMAQDRRGLQIENLYLNNYNAAFTYKNIIENLNKVTKEDIKNIANKIKLNTIYFVDSGDKNAKN